ncbi:MAG: hypothetical protein RL173_1980 [Fibrobacterota bacterium]|jgi:hypothetical protein
MADPSLLIPALDPIPLPAPVALFKFLHILTLTLHFGALQLLLGGLLLATVWNIYGQVAKSNAATDASGTVVRKLSIVTTYVINFGVPPLLFAQILYGRALYTSSVLIATWWISVVFLVMAAYALLYRMSSLADKNRPWWIYGIVSFSLFAWVGRLFSTNMTLMLKPEVWKGMYETTASGTLLPQTDPTMWPRFAIVFLGALSIGALGTSLWSGLSSVSDDGRIFLRRWSAIAAIICLPLLALAGIWAISSQPESVKVALATGLNAQLSLAWLGTVAAAFLCAVGLLVTARSKSLWISGIGSTLGVVALALWTSLRDIVRDLTLIPKGLDVWANPVSTNWLVVGLFLGSLVAGIALIIWLLVVVAKAAPPEKSHV